MARHKHPDVWVLPRWTEQRKYDKGEEDERVAWLEAQASQTLQYVLESREILRSEAHTTLNWLFGLTAAAASYVFVLASEHDGIDQRLVTGLAVVAFVAAGFSVWLLRRMSPGSTMPAGNEPRNLIVEDYFKFPLAQVRLAEFNHLQQKIDETRNHNHTLADTIARCRFAFCLLAVATGAIGAWVAFT